MPAVNQRCGVDLPAPTETDKRSQSEQAAKRGVQAETHTQLL